MLLRALETEHLRINIRWSALAPLSLNNLQTGYSSNPSETACCFPREFTRHWPPIFGMKLPPFSRFPARPVSRMVREKASKNDRGKRERRIRSIGRNNEWLARETAATISRTMRRIITSNTPDDTQAILRFTYARARIYYTLYSSDKPQRCKRRLLQG